MPDVLIRGLTAEAVRRIDAEAAALGLSRNDYLRRKLEAGVTPPVGASVTDAFQDLADPGVMDSAWR